MNRSKAMALTLALALALQPGLLLAVPLQVAHQGELTDADGPVTGVVELTFELFAAEVGGEPVWAEVREVDVVDGYYSTLLGSEEQSTPIEAVLAQEPDLHLQLTIGGAPLLPRLPLGSTPYAIIADSAVNLDGGTVNASSIAVNGDAVVDGSGHWAGGPGSIAWDAITGGPGDADTLGGLSCGDGSVARWDAGLGQWACASDLVLTAAEVLGIVGGAQIDLGTGSSMAGTELATLDDLDWSLLSSVPLGFADDVDDDSLGLLGALCADGDRAGWDAAAGDWTCMSEEVGLERLATAGATGGQVLTFDGVNVGWEDPATGASSACTLVVLDETLGGAKFDCGSQSVVLRTWLQVTQVDAGATHACGIDSAGAVHCWGSDSSGQSSPPAGVFTQVSAGVSDTCAVADSGAVQCWGSNNAGQSSPPSGVFTQVSVGQQHACGIDGSGAVQCWGSNSAGQSSPSGGVFAQVSAGEQHSCAVSASGSILCWGSDSNGQSTPSGGTFTQVSAGSSHTCAVNSGGAVQCWGYNSGGQASPPGGTFMQVSVGHDHTCGVTAGGAAQCWGLDSFGQSSPPTGTFSQVSSGRWFGCAVAQSLGTVVCWGEEGDGQTLPP
jgi:hypothetical protein